MGKGWFSQGIILWAVQGALALIGGGAITYLKLHSSEWADPLLWGAWGAAAIFIIGVAMRVSLSLPKMEPKITAHNVESYVRGWLDGARASIKSDPTPDSYFRLVVTLSTGPNLIVGRPKGQWENYVLVRADIASPETQPEELRSAPQEDGERLAEMTKLELARARMAYSGLFFPLREQFAVFTRIPINGLSHDSFMSGVDRAEAAVNVINIVYGMWLKRGKKSAADAAAVAPHTAG